MAEPLLDLVVGEKGAPPELTAPPQRQSKIAAIYDSLSGPKNRGDPFINFGIADCVVTMRLFDDHRNPRFARKLNTAGI